MKKSLLFISLALTMSIVACGKDPGNDGPVDPVIPVDETFKITYVNYDDSVLYSYDAKQFEEPKYVGDVPTKPSTDEATYTFSGWDPKPVTVTKDATYKAKFTTNQRDIYLGEIKDEYYLYKDYIKTYVLATMGNDIEDGSTSKNVHSYIQSGEAYAPITFTWTQNLNNVTGINFTYSLNSNYSDAKVLNLDANATSVELYNLLKGTTYYAKLEALTGATSYSKEFSFSTANIGPRSMKVDGITNVRDLGGYQTDSGKVTLQNMVFRGSEMNGIHNFRATENGLRTLAEDMGIKTDIDLRNSSELIEPNGTVITDTPIPNARFANISANNYTNSITDSSSMAKVFKLLADKRNYPAYIHCYGGADRTGTVCFLFNALLGVSLDDLIHDFEFTSFSAIGERNSKNVSTGGEAGKFYAMYHKLLELYPEGTLSQKVEKYLLNAGLSSTEISNIKAINLGEPIHIDAKVNHIYCQSFVDKLTIDVNDLTGLQKVYVDNAEVNFTLGDYQIFVEQSELTSLVDNNHEVKLVYEGRDNPITCQFKSINQKVYEVEELYNISDSSACVTADTTFNFSNAYIGYGTFVRAKIKTVTKQNSGFYFMIGSYGVYLRGKQVRLQRMTSTNSPGTAADYGVLGTFPDEKMFNNGNLDMVLGVSTNETSVDVTFAVLNDDGSIYSDIFYETSSTALKYSSGEIAGSNARFGFKIVNDQTLGGSIYAYSHAQKAYVDSSYTKGDFKVYLRDVDETAKLYINDVEYEYVLDGFTLIVNQKAMFNVDVGNASGVVVFNNRNFEFSFTREEIVPYCDPVYIYGDYVVTLPGCDDSITVKLNGNEVSFTIEGDNIIIGESNLRPFGYNGVINGEIINGDKTYHFAFSKEKATVSVAEVYIDGDLIINLPGVKNTAALMLNDVDYAYTLDEEFNLIVSESNLADLPSGTINGSIYYDFNFYYFSFLHAQSKDDVELSSSKLEYIDSDVLGYDGAIVDFDIVTNTAGSGNGHLVAGIGGYGINFRGGRLRFFYLNKTSSFVTSDFDAHSFISQDAKLSESNFSAAPGHIRLVSSVDEDGKVTLTATITISKQVSTSYLEKGVYTFSYTYAANASTIAGNDIHSFFSIDGTKQITTTISNYVVAHA